MAIERSAVILQDIIGVFSMLYKTGDFSPQKFPNLHDITPLLPQYTPVAIQDVLLSSDFARLANQRGIPYYFSKDQQQGLSSRQMYCVSIMLDFTSRETKAQRLARAGVSAAEYSNWMKFKPFRNMIDTGSEHQLAEHYNDINRALVQQAETGDVPAIKFAFELMGKYDPNAKQIMEVQTVMARMIEIIQKHVTDPLILASIASDLQGLANKTGIGAVNTYQGEVVTNGNHYEIGSI